MIQIAAHYIYYKAPFRMHYIVLDDAKRVKGVYPFEEELAMTVFVDGLVFPVIESKASSAEDILQELIHLQMFHPAATVFDLLALMPFVVAAADTNESVVLFRVHGCNFSSPKFSTDNRGGDGYVERL